MNTESFDVLVNTGMLYRMLEDYNKFSSTYKGYSKLYVWRKWIRA